MAYIGKSPTGTGIRQRYYFTATGSETSLSGTDDNNLTLSFTDGAYVDVSLNGVALVAGTDYNTSTANTISGLSALAANDVVEIIVYDVFTVADTVSASNGGTFSGNVAFGDNNKAQFGAGNDLQVFHDGLNSWINDTGTGNLLIGGGNEVRITSPSAGEFMATFVNNGAVNLYYDNATKLATTSTGVDVTGDLSISGDINRPVVTARKGADQTVSRATWTKITGITTAEYDSHSAWNGSKFTVPSGQAGRYLVTLNFYGKASDAGSDGEAIFGAIYVNGTSRQWAGINMANGGRHMSQPRFSVSQIYDLDVSDYVEFYGYLQDDSASGTLKIGGVSGGTTGATAISIVRID